MAEKRVLEDYVVSGVTHLRHQHGYPKAFRMAAGAFHAFNTVAYGIGGASVILGKDIVINAARKNGMGIQAISSLGQGIVVLGAFALGIALLHAWAAFLLFTARQRAYWFVALINILTFLWMVVLTTPGGPIQWAQAALALLVAFVLLFDPRVKAFYYKGPFAEAWWDEELRRRKGQARSEFHA